jgi:acid phosphatase
LVAGIDKGELPQVAFYKPEGVLNQHPGYADILSGDEHIAALLQRIKASPLWSTTAVIVTYDENGGFWDHVPPPTGPGWGDRWGPATRIPALVISPLAKRGYIDSTAYDTTSILKLITVRFGLEPLPGVRERMGDLTAALAAP